MRYLWKAGLALFGWKTDMEFPYHHVKKYVLLIGPHTSNWDFVIGLAYRNILKINRTRFLAKKELFTPPFGFIFYWLGGTPVDRKSNHNMVDQVADLFKEHDHFSVCLSPEGTRKKVDRLRSGFYFIAKAANVPIIMVGLDYSRKTVLFSPPFNTTDSQVSDMEVVAKFYRTIEGKRPDQGMMHL
jgi:1-acyl-sn-glycerol-3-phosphate acyltransferase